MATYIQQRDAALAQVTSLIYPNGVGAINGQAHQDNEVNQTNDAYLNLVSYDGFAFVIVRTGIDPATGNEANTAAQNGANLLAAYAAAKLLTPGGNALSATNRAAVLVPPGVYALGSSQLLADTEFVDIVGMGASPKDVVITSNDSSQSTLLQSANDMVIRGITLKHLADASATGRAAYEIDTVSAFSLVMEDVILSGNGTTSGATVNAAYITQDYYGTFKNVQCENSPYPSWDGILWGTWIDCSCTGDAWCCTIGGITTTAVFERCSCVNGFGIFGAVFEGTYTDCEVTGRGFGSGDDCAAIGIYTRCKANSLSFGSGLNAIAGGTFIDCEANDSSFGWGDGATCNASIMLGCWGKNNCFGSSTSGAVFQNCRGDGTVFNSPLGSACTLAGTYINCYGGPTSFGGGGTPSTAEIRTLSGKFYNCVAGNQSFGGQAVIGTAVNAFTATLSGEFKDCRAGNLSFGTRRSTLSGTFTNCSAGNQSFGCGWESNTISALSGKFYHCVGGNYCFGTSAVMGLDAEFHHCVAGSNSFGDSNNTGIACSSKFYHCRGLDACWTYASTSDARYEYCSGRNGCFGFSTYSGGLTLAGTYIGCVAGTGSFGAALATSGYTIDLSGIFIDCSSGDNSFAYQTATTSQSFITGRLINCRGGDNCFGVVSPGSAGFGAVIDPTAVLDSCTAGENSFASSVNSTKEGALIRCRTYNYITGVEGMANDDSNTFGTMRDCIWTITDVGGASALKIDQSAKIYGGQYKGSSGATYAIESFSGGAIAASIANVMLNLPVDPNITNDISSPNVIVDANV